MFVMKSVQTVGIWVAVVFFALAPLSRAEQTVEKRKKDTAELDDMVVTATRTARQLGEVPASVSVIDQEGVEKSPGQRVEDILATVPGIDQQGQYTFGRGRSELYMRGINSTGKVMVMVDGIPANSSYGGTVEWSMISPDTIERIEVVRGPASSLYGSHAMAGVINIITKKPARDHEIVFKQEYGSQETWSSSLSSQGRGDKFGYRLSGRFKASEGYYSHRPQEPWDTKSDCEIKNIDGDLFFFPDERSSLKLGLSHLDRDFGRGYRSNDIERELDRANLIYERESAKVNWRASAYYNKEYQFVDFSGTSPPYEVVVQNEEHTWPFYGAMLQSSIVLAGWNTLTIGAEYKHSSIEARGFNYISEPGRYNDTEGKQEYISVYFQEEMLFFDDNLIVNLGARQDWWKSFDGYHFDNTFPERNAAYEEKSWDSFNPKLGLLYHITGNTALRASAAKGFAAPALSRLYLVLPRGRIMMYGNPELEPETLIGYEAGVDHFFTDNLSLGLTFYHSDGEDFIGHRYLDATTMVYDNISEVQMRGIEAALKYSINEQWSAWLNYTYNESTIEKDPTAPETEGDYLPYVPKNKGNFRITYDNPDFFTASCTVKYVGKRYSNVPNEDGKELDDFTTIDLYLAKNIKKNFKLYLACQDVFDEQPVELIWANRATRENEDVVAPGRLITAGVEVKF
jgi:iron complex outermembrane recepter protein